MHDSVFSLDAYGEYGGGGCLWEYSSQYVKHLMSPGASRIWYLPYTTKCDTLSIISDNSHVNINCIEIIWFSKLMTLMKCIYMVSRDTTLIYGHCIRDVCSIRYYSSTCILNAIITVVLVFSHSSIQSFKYSTFIFD